MMLPESMAQLRARQLRSRQLHHVDPLCQETASSHSSQFVALPYRVEQQARETPEHPAVIAEGNCLTYAALNLQANQLAHHLRRLGALPGMGVGVCLGGLASPSSEGSPQLVVTLLAILKTGAAFVPLDPTDTPERIALIMEDAGLEILVTQEVFWDRLPASEAKLVLLDLDAAAIQQLSGENLQRSGVAGEAEGSAGDAVILPQDLACQLYASDTAGIPKGVSITHGAVANLLRSMGQEPDMAAGESSELSEVTQLLVTMTVRDRALLALFLPLTLGATVVFAREASAHRVTGMLLPGTDEAERMQHTVDRILTLEPKRVLEVGCGQGSLLFQVAPHCDRYWAIDPSAAALGHLSQQLQQTPLAWSHVAIAQGQADAIATLLTQLSAEHPSSSGFHLPRFDTIVLNDVIQSFPHVDYLVAVIEQLMTHLEPGGRLFIGDVRHVGLRRAFHTAVQLHQDGSDGATSDDESARIHLRQQIQSRLVQAQELSLDPDFFRALVRRLEGVAGVTLQLKRGQNHHALNDCCYDVVLHRAVTSSESRLSHWGLGQGRRPMQWLGSTLQQQLLADVERCDLLHVAHYLHAVQPETLGFRNLPNPRLWDIARACEQLGGGQQQDKSAIAPIEPEQWWALSRTLPYQVHLSWAASGRWDCYDVRLHRTDADPMVWANLSLIESPLRESQPWAAYGNCPSASSLSENDSSANAPSPNGSETVMPSPVAQMLADAELDPEIQPAIQPAIASSSDLSSPGSFSPGASGTRRILLTGAISLLGAFLLAELLQSSEATIDCLIQAENPAEAQRQLENHLERYELPWEQHRHRIRALCGDLSQPNLGLTPACFQQLAQRVDAIYHTGPNDNGPNNNGAKEADVQALYSYEALRQAHILGTQEILRLASCGRRKSIHYVSTLDVIPMGLVADGQRRDRPKASETDPLSPPDLMVGGEAQSKWVAEKLLREAQTRGIPSHIYRLGQIVGHSETGAGTGDDWMARWIRGLIQLGAAPAIDFELNLMPVDDAARSLVQLSCQAPALQEQETASPTAFLRGQTFHLANPHPLVLSTLVAALRRFGYSLRQLPYQDWRQALKSSAQFDGNGLSPLLNDFPTEAPTGSVLRLPHVSQQLSLSHIEALPFHCSRINTTLIQRYIRDLIRHHGLAIPGHPSDAQTELHSTAVR